jgi:hypothetical protein
LSRSVWSSCRRDSAPPAPICSTFSVTICNRLGFFGSYLISAVIPGWTRAAFSRETMVFARRQARPWRGDVQQQSTCGLSLIGPLCPDLHHPGPRGRRSRFPGRRAKDGHGEGAMTDRSVPRGDNSPLFNNSSDCALRLDPVRAPEQHKAAGPRPRMAMMELKKDGRKPFPYLLMERRQRRGPGPRFYSKESCHAPVRAHRTG